MKHITYSSLQLIDQLGHATVFGMNHEHSFDINPKINTYCRTIFYIKCEKLPPCSWERTTHCFNVNSIEKFFRS